MARAPASETASALAPFKRVLKGPFKGGDHDGQIMMDVLQSYNAQDDDGGAAPQLRWGAIHADAPLTPVSSGLLSDCREVDEDDLPPLHEINDSMGTGSEA